MWEWLKQRSVARAGMRQVALRIMKAESDIDAHGLRMCHEDAAMLARLVLAYTEAPSE